MAFPLMTSRRFPSFDLRLAVTVLWIADSWAPVRPMLAAIPTLTRSRAAIIVDGAKVSRDRWRGR